MPLAQNKAAAAPYATIVADYLESAIQEMRKRCWQLNEDGKPFEDPDGCVPIWWLRKEIDRLRLMDPQLPSRKTTSKEI
jgi:hypothetical protein